MTSSNDDAGRRQRGVKRSTPHGVQMLGLVFALVAVSFVAYSGNRKSLASYLPKRSLTIQTADNVGTYNQDSIIKAAPHFPKFVPKLLVWDGKKFQVFGLQHRNSEFFESMKYTYRYIDTVPLLVNALMTNFPDRFKKDTPPFELLFSDADSPHSKCINTKDCPVEEFSPILLFGSVPKDQSVFPTMRSFPNPVFARCLYEYQINGKDIQCDWQQKVNSELNWNDLQETIVWRGADWAFLNYDDRFKVDGPGKLMEGMSAGKWKGKSKDEIVSELLAEPLVDNFGPRWRAGLLSTQAEGQEVPWIDSRFVGGENVEIHQALARKGANITGDKMDSFQMSNYKYQIDFGGGGGTTWEGTLTKLMMPGVLFHHETANKDWFYDMIEPWKHYIPVEWDLSNLQSAYSVAQNNPDRAYAVSQEATKLAEYLLSPEYMAQAYQELFVEYLGKLVANYEPPEEGSQSWEAMAAKYKKKGFNVYNIGVCQGKKCSIQCRAGEKSDVLFINSDAPTRGSSAGLRGGLQDEDAYAQQDQQQPQQNYDNGDYNSGYADIGNQQYDQGYQQNQNYGQQQQLGEGNAQGYDHSAYSESQQDQNYPQGYEGQEQQYVGSDNSVSFEGSYGYGDAAGKQQYGNGSDSQPANSDATTQGYDQSQYKQAGNDQQTQQESGWDQQQGGYNPQQGGWNQQEQGGWNQEQRGNDQQQSGWNEERGGWDQSGGEQPEQGWHQQQGGWDQQSGYGQQQQGDYEQQRGDQEQDGSPPQVVASESRRGRGRSLGYDGPNEGYGASTIGHEGRRANEGPPRSAPNEEQKKFLSSDQLSKVGVNDVRQE